MTRQPQSPLIRLLGAALVAALAVRPVAAQLPSASASALGVGDNYTALARGYNAVAWNPAGLAMPGNPGFSLAIMPLRGIGGLGPITLGDVADYEGTLLPDHVKEEWLRRISEGGGERGNAGLDVTYLAVSVGRIGLQVASSGYATSNLAPDAAELLLYGNAGRTGEPHSFTLRSSTVDAAVTTTMGVSYAHPLGLKLFSLPGQAASVGATVKYIVGNAVAHGQDLGSTLSSDATSILLEFPIVSSDSGFAGTKNGSGVGLDLGAAWKGGPWSMALAVQNVVNTFQWDVSQLSYRPGHAYFDSDSSESDGEARPLSEAPAELHDAITDLRYKPAVALGVAMTPFRKLTVSADVRRRFGNGMGAGPRTHAGVGLEFRPLGLLPLRAGLARVDDSFQGGGGLGLQMGPVNLAVSAAQRWGGNGDGALGAFSLSFGAR